MGDKIKNMEIVHLTELNNIESIQGHSIQGLTENEIIELESKYNDGKKFPVAYREYLFIAGKNSGLSIDEGLGFEWLQEKAMINLEEFGQVIDRPFFVIDQIDACEIFCYIYLDEVEENPDVYVCVTYNKEEGKEVFYSHPSKNFKTFIQNKIEDALSWEDACNNVPSDNN